MCHCQSTGPSATCKDWVCHRFRVSLEAIQLFLAIVAENTEHLVVIMACYLLMHYGFMLCLAACAASLGQRHTLQANKKEQEEPVCQVSPLNLPVLLL